MFYKNNSFVAKTFYGITFQPGEIHEVPGYINDKKFDVVAEPKSKEPPAQVEQSTKSEEPKETVKTDGRKTRKKRTEVNEVSETSATEIPEVQLEEIHIKEENDNGTDCS
jgi:hypothetical protein